MNLAECIFRHHPSGTNDDDLRPCLVEQQRHHRHHDNNNNNNNTVQHNELSYRAAAHALEEHQHWLTRRRNELLLRGRFHHGDYY